MYSAPKVDHHLSINGAASPLLTPTASVWYILRLKLVALHNKSMRDSPLKLSVVVPFYNEEQSIRPLHSTLVAALTTLGRPYEMVFVDDGSSDQTFQIAVQLAREDPRVRVVKFRRNYGQTAAMAAGIEYSRGEIIVTMDGDLQNDPADIGAFLEKIDEGNDIVVGWRFNRQDKLTANE